MKASTKGKQLNTLRFKAVIGEKGKLVLEGLPYPENSKIEVIILKEGADLFEDITKASESSLKFWNNKIDDEVWNNV